MDKGLYHLRKKELNGINLIPVTVSQLKPVSEFYGKRSQIVTLLCLHDYAILAC